MNKIKFFIPILLISVILISGCTSNKVKKDLPASTTAIDVVPQSIEGYTKVNTNELAAKAASASVGVVVGIVTEGDIITAYQSAQFTDKFIKCYQDAGAVDSGSFYMISDPRYGGVVAAVDKNQITDPNLLFKCIKKSVAAMQVVQKQFQPCSVRFTIETDYNEFYVIMIGTDTSVCQTFCDNMPACPSEWQ